LACFNEFERIHQAWTGFWPLLMVGVQLIVLLVWVLGLPRVLEPAGVASLSAGTFISFVLYMTMFMQPIEVIGQMARMVNRATSSAYRVFEVLDTEPQIREEGERVRLERLEGRVRFENVFFSYDGVRSILKNLSFEVEPGEMIGIVGPSGSGKSTIINLLARFYDASEGRVLIDGVDIKDLELGSYRRQVGMVLQDPYLFHGSILDNIRYARPDATLEEVVAAAQAANAHKFISSLTHGYDTIVGERGHTLSGGERQRVSIARAVLLNPRILILDEATSAVDTETERQIQDALDRLVKGRTVFAIAHRLSTLTRADRLLVIKNGRLIEEGRHVELLAKPGGVFAGLSKMQQELHASQVI
jgi:ATP-binding cassette subfamily B protein